MNISNFKPSVLVMPHMEVKGGDCVNKHVGTSHIKKKLRIKTKSY